MDLDQENRKSHFKRALVSVSDKTGLVDALRPLVSAGLEVVSTGGTAVHLREHGIKVIDVSEQTGFKEVMDGRVKTLHPNVHMALLARLGNHEDEKTLESFGLGHFDLVIGNLYPFEATFMAAPSLEDLIENIDIGGPSFLRAAAKNFAKISVFVDPKDYVLLGSGVSLAMRRQLAVKVFSHTASYDALIAKALPEKGEPPILQATELPLKVLEKGISLKLISELRYGENPQQKASWYKQRGESLGLDQAQILQGKELSYNNLLDLDAAVMCLRSMKRFEQAVKQKAFEVGDNGKNLRACGVAIKHNNPCGAAFGVDVLDALKKLRTSDPVSIFGGILAFDQKLDADCAALLSEMFLECIIAPAYEPEALEIFAKKKNLRVLAYADLVSGLNNISSEKSFLSIWGGVLEQQKDVVVTLDFFKNLGSNESWNPSGPRVEDFALAEIVGAHLKSNAIAIVCGGQTLGLGMGQVNRVDAVEQAIGRAQKFHAEEFKQNAEKIVLYSDAFFPFPDSIEKIADAGIKWILQPRGSVNDAVVFARAKELGLNIFYTGERHFRH